VHLEKHNYSIKRLCEVLQVCRAGYYRWLKRKTSRSSIRRKKLLQRILEIFEESRESYGCPRVFRQLRREGFKCSRRTVETIMREHEISPKRKRKYKSTTDSNHDLPVTKNWLNRQFDTQEQDEVWVSDITYVETQEGWLYLCVFIDLFSRSVIGWSMDSTMTAQLVVDAFEMARKQQGQVPRLSHSDRGSQYASHVFRRMLKELDVIQSMSRKANCWDNAVAESFFGALKSELVYRNFFETRRQAVSAIFEYIEIFYNKRRLHSGLGYLTPWEKGQKGKKAA
jgi:transposase InsO family protein